MNRLLFTLLLSGSTYADNLFGFNTAPEVETRSLDEIYQAALAEGGVVTCWHGGDETNQQDGLKQAFEERFPGMTLNITVDLSKYHDVAIDEQLANDNVIVDSVILQTLNDFPRWAAEGSLLNYAPLGFDEIKSDFKDSVSAAWYGLFVFSWSIIWNTQKLPNVTISEWEDLLRPELRNKLVLTYPNDDDAVLYAFDIIMQHLGTEWFDALLAQNPRWVRGTATPATILMAPNASQAITFTSEIGFTAPPGVRIVKPQRGQFVSWAQTGAILKDAPHPEGAKLLHSFMLTPEYQQVIGWSVRRDVELPEGFPFGELDSLNNTNANDFARWMEDRPRVERLRFWFENKLGSAQGKSPLLDDL